MEEKNIEELNKDFLASFDFENLGFYKEKYLTNVPVGFTAKKRLYSNDKNVTHLKIYITEEEMRKNGDRKGLEIFLFYGKENKDGGLSYREDVKLSEPIDVFFPNEFFYNIKNKKFFRYDQEISSNNLINLVYSNHIKSTKFFKGLFIRNKIRLYRKFFSVVFEILSKIFSKLIWLTSGDVYKYGFEEHLARRLNIQKTKPLKELEDKKESPITFLGYKAKAGCILFYSSFHFVIFCLFFYFKFFPNFLIMIFENGFLTLIYVMMSLIFVDKILPIWLRKFTDKSYELSYHFSYDTIKV